MRIAKRVSLSQSLAQSWRAPPGLEYTCVVWCLTYSSGGLPFLEWRLLLLLLRKKWCSSFVWNSQGAVFYSHRSEWLWFADCRHIFYFSQKKRHVTRQKGNKTFMLRFSRSGSFRLSKCPVYTCAHIKYWSNWRVCTCVYKHTPTHHPNTRRNREMYKTNPLSLPLSKHSLSRKQQAKVRKKPHFQFFTTHACRCWKNTCDTLACSRGTGQYK